jgi:cysteine-rich repeat protein
MKAIFPSAALIALTACDMFDPDLYRNAQSLAIASDVCIESAVPVLGPSQGVVQMMLDDMNDDWQVPNCGQQPALGNDSFFAVDLEAGRKLHIHVNAVDALDPTVYIVDSCDQRVCQPLNAASYCPGGKEHLSFLAPLTDRYFVGVDSVDPGGGRVEVLAIAPVCGDGTKDHGEPCEDGNTDRGDGCDDYCRNEVVASERTELEPNDDLASGNVLASIDGAARFVVRGKLEGPCDPEVFSFELARPATASVRLQSPSGDDCVVLGAGNGVELILYQGLLEVARATSDVRGCVALEVGTFPAPVAPGVRPAAPSTYHVQLRALPSDEPAPFSYALAIELR